MSPVIVALDVNSSEQALQLVEAIGPAVDFYKVGMELYAAAGAAVAAYLADRGKRVFLDLKLYDIGETVKRATEVLCTTVKPTYLTVHGSETVMRAAVAGRGSSNTELLAVTVLTSFDQQDLADLGYPVPIADLVELRVQKAIAAGVNGLVCSPLEVARVRQLTGPAMHLITPGVRSAGAASGDQKRVATPAEAVANGANYVVLGRQIIRAEDPRAAVEQVLSDLAV